MYASAGIMTEAVFYRLISSPRTTDACHFFLIASLYRAIPPDGPTWVLIANKLSLILPSGKEQRLSFRLDWAIPISHNFNCWKVLNSHWSCVLYLLLCCIALTADICNPQSWNQSLDTRWILIYWVHLLFRYLHCTGTTHCHFAMVILPNLILYLVRRGRRQTPVDTGCQRSLLDWNYYDTHSRFVDVSDAQICCHACWESFQEVKQSCTNDSSPGKRSPTPSDMEITK